MPLAEKLLWVRLKTKQLKGYKFRRQYSVEYFILDFYCPQAKLAIEIDGNSHFYGETPEYDLFRQKSIEEVGIKFLRFTNNDIYQNIEEVIITIINHLP